MQAPQRGHANSIRLTIGRSDETRITEPRTWFGFGFGFGFGLP